MDSGSYNNVRRGTMPLASAAPSASYKANVNRTKTRKWVEAKVQSYDGDDWGNDYDDYDDGNDQHYEPEPEPEPLPTPAARPAGPRQPGPTGYQLPSSRTFSQPAAASLPSNTNPRLFGPSTLRSSSGAPSLHVQTQPPPPATTSPSPPYTIESAYPTAVSPSHAAVPPGSQSAGPAATPVRFPPRKSSMGQQDRPDIDNKSAPKPDSRPGSSSSNRPWAGQRPASPSQGPAPPGRTLPFVRPSDIYKRMGEEKEKERLSSESGRPSLDSLVGRTEGTSSPSQFRSSGEQRRRTSFESHDGSEPPRARKSSLAPVAERKSEYGMDGFLVKAPTDQSPFLQEPTTSSPELSRLSNEPSDEIKSDLLKSRRFSTSPQLPFLTRVSGFGDDFFSGSSGHSSQASPKLPTPAEERRSLHNDMDVIKPPVDNTEKQPPNTLGATKEVSTELDVKPPEVASPEVTEEGTMQSTQPQYDRTRPQLPGGWVSESLSILVPSEQSTPSEKQEAKGPTNFANIKSISVSPMTESGPEPSGIFSSTGNPSLPPSTDTPGNVLNVNGANQPSAKGRGTATGQHNNAMASGALVASEHHPTPQSLPPLKTEISSTQPLSRPISTVAPAIRDMRPEQPTTITTSGSGFSPTAPLNFNRAQAVGQSDFILPSTRIRKSTNSTIDTTSPEKDNDKLRDEIIKSLSPAPISPGSSGLPAKAEQGIEQAPGDLTRESTYLAGVYDDYLSPTEEKSPREVNPTANESTPMAPNQSSETPNASAAKLRDMSISQTVQMAPPHSVQSPVPEESTRLRRFSWQQDPEEVVLSPTESKPDTSVFPQESLVRSQSGMNAESSTNLNTVSPITDSLQAEAGAAGTISHQVSQVSSRGLEDTTLAAIEPPSPISFVGARGPHPASDERNIARLSLADEKEKVLIGDTQSATSSVSDQHPALAKAPEQGDRGPSPVLRLPDVAASRPQATPTPFREILNFATYEERVQKFDETREQFYVMDSGLSNWLNYLQGQPEHADASTTYSSTLLLSKPGTQPAPGAPGVSQIPFKTGTAASNPRRSSIGNMQQLMAGQSGGFGASGVQVGTKSKELLHAAGAFGNKGMKSGMKLFNKGKNKLRERAAGDKAFF